MNWFVFAILSPLFWGVENYVGKLVAMRGMDSKKVTTVFSGTVCLLSLVAMLLAKEPVLDWRFLLVITIFTAITFFFSMILRLNVLAVIDASVLYPFHKIMSLDKKHFFTKEVIAFSKPKKILLPGDFVGRI